MWLLEVVVHQLEGMYYWMVNVVQHAVRDALSVMMMMMGHTPPLRQHVYFFVLAVCCALHIDCAVHACHALAVCCAVHHLCSSLHVAHRLPLAAASQVPDAVYGLLQVT